MVAVQHSILAIAVALALVSCGGGPEMCDSAAIRASLAAASPGDMVQVGSCRVEGPFLVPAGVTLRGLGIASVIAAPADGNAVELVGDDAVLSDVLVDATGRVGIVVRARAQAARVRVEASQGIAIGVSEAGELDLISVQLIGATPAATYGLVVRGGSVTGASVDVLHFTEVGVLVEQGGTAGLSQLDVGFTLGVAVLVRDSSLTLVESVIHDTQEGLRGRPSYALLSGNSDVTSTRLGLEDNDRFGVVAVGGSASHLGLSALRTGDVAFWAAGLDSLTLGADERGEATSIADGAFAGVVITDSAHVSVSDVRVDGVRSSRRPVGLIGAVEIGDGVHIIRSHDDVSLARVEVLGAERAGLTLELSAGTTAPTFADVMIESSGSALGAVAGLPEAGTDTLRVGAAAAGWDSGITRTGTALANDAAFSGTLDAVLSAMPPRADEALGVVAPMY